MNQSVDGPGSGPQQGEGGERRPVHISVVLDRSGSMASIAGPIVAGFNEFLAEQRRAPGVAKVTLVQFDSEDPFEVVIDAVDLREVTDLDRARYEPRAATPLYDAVGRMIGRVDAAVAARRDLGLRDEDQMVVIVTDGLENASREHGRRAVFEMIEERRRQGWVFVFLGAGQDAYAESEKIGVSAGNTARWQTTEVGTRKMWKDVSHSARLFREKQAAARRRDVDSSFVEAPEDEED